MRKRPSKLARISPDVYASVAKRAKKKRLTARQELDAVALRGMECEDREGRGK